MSTVSDKAEIENLRQRVGALEAENARLRRPPPRESPRSAPEPQVRIYHPSDVSPIALADDQQLQRLADIVLAKYPQLGPDVTNPRWASMNVQEFHRGFHASFRRIASLNRDKDDRFDATRSIQHFTDEAEDWWRAQGQPADIRWPVYLAAAIAAGDIQFSIEPPLVGLRTDGVGQPATPAWRDILNGRALRSPTPPR